MGKYPGEERTLKKKNALITMIVVVLVLILAVAGALGYLWYQENHLFVEDAVYPLNAESLDLRGQDISFSHYDTVHWQLPNCYIVWDVPFQGGKVSSDSTSLAVKSLTQEDLDIIYRYLPDLKVLDATGCTDYDLLEKFRQDKPDCRVAYQVDVGGTWADPAATELTLEPQDFQLEALKAGLPHLPDVTSVTFRKAELTLEDLEALREAFETVTFQATVELLGTEYDSETTQLDLSAMESGDVEAISKKLALLPALTDVELMDAQGSCKLTLADVKELKDAASQVSFHFTFDFFGQTINTADKDITVKNAKIGDDNLDSVREVLDMLDGCERFVLDSCGISNENMAALREEYRGKTKVVWRASVANGSILTDAECLYLTWHLKNSNCENLKYFEDCRFLDAGHNETGQWTDVSFVSGMTNLEVIILSGSSVKDLSAFENCKKLRVLEAGFCGLIEDISPLAGCESLEMLNISYSKVQDLSPLDELDIKLLCDVQSYRSSLVPDEAVEHFKSKHPEAEVYCGISDQPYGQNWRYEPDDPLKFRAWYEEMRTALDYEHYEKNFDKGWYLTDTGERDTSRTA